MTTAEDVVSHVTCGVNNIHGRSKRRRVADFKIGEIIQGGLTNLEHGCHGIGAGLNSVTVVADSLDAKNPFTWLVYNNGKADIGMTG
jgi:hypothetical protein